MSWFRGKVGRADRVPARGASWATQCAQSASPGQLRTLAAFLRVRNQTEAAKLEPEEEATTVPAVRSEHELVTHRQHDVTENVRPGRLCRALDVKREQRQPEDGGDPAAVCADPLGEVKRRKKSCRAFDMEMTDELVGAAFLGDSVGRCHSAIGPPVGERLDAAAATSRMCLFLRPVACLSTSARKMSFARA